MDDLPITLDRGGGACHAQAERSSESAAAAAGGITVTRQGSISDTLTAMGDLYPLASLRWNSGVNNWLVYGTGDIPRSAMSTSRSLPTTDATRRYARSSRGSSVSARKSDTFSRPETCKAM